MNAKQRRTYFRKHREFVLQTVLTMHMVGQPNRAARVADEWVARGRTKFSLSDSRHYAVATCRRFHAGGFRVDQPAEIVTGRVSKVWAEALHQAVLDAKSLKAAVLAQAYGAGPGLVIHDEILTLPP